MKCVIVETPYSSPDPAIVARNLRFARACMKDSLDRGEAPYLSHLLYTQVYDDNDPALREAGIKAGLEIGRRLDTTVVYTNLGISPGMHMGIRAAEEAGREIIWRELGVW
jgi:hypothetical protein